MERDDAGWEYYLIRLSYTSTAWDELIGSKEDVTGRLAPVLELIGRLEGSLATFHFFEPGQSEDTGKPSISQAASKPPKPPPPPPPRKFVMFSRHDLLAVVAFPNKRAAHAFHMVLSAEPGIKELDLTAIMPIEEALDARALAMTARRETAYRAPGRPR